MIMVENVSKKYGNNKEALSKVSFSLYENEIAAIVGPNGAGKSTLLRILAEINSATEGQVVKGKEARVGAVFDGNGLYLQMTAYENMSFFYRLNKNNALNKEQETIDDLLRRVGLFEARNGRVKNFSKGMARKLAIARALLTDPDILLMDEPFDGLDITSHAFLVDFLRRWVKEKRHMLFFSSHNMADVEMLCDRVLLLQNGKLKNNISMIDLNKKITDRYRIVVRGTDKDLSWLSEEVQEESLPENGKIELLTDKGIEEANRILSELVKHNLIIAEFSPIYKSMEEIYLSEVGCKE